MSTLALGYRLRTTGSRLGLVLMAVALNAAVFCGAFWMISAQPESPETIRPRLINYRIPSPPPPPKAQARPRVASPQIMSRLKSVGRAKSLPEPVPRPSLTPPPLTLAVQTQVLPGPKLEILAHPEPKAPVKLRIKSRPIIKPEPVAKPKPSPKSEPEVAPRPDPKPKPAHKVAVKAAPTSARPSQLAQAAGPALKTAAPSSRTSGPPHPVPVKISPPGLISRIPPVYPYHARRRGLEGWVKIRLMVDKKGRVEEVAILEAEPVDVFDRAVIRAARRWRFQPALRAGRAVAAAYQTVVRFRLK